MFITPTVFILGAGASMPYGFPSGQKLVEHAIDWATNLKDPRYPKDYSRIFAQELALSGRSSVDAFIEHRTEFMDIGKASIATHLLNYENANRNSNNRDWYEWLLDRMTAGVPFDNLKQNKLTFITFNYDRSLERRLHAALSATYGKSSTEVAEVLKHFQFVHVHGQLGFLPWQHSDKDKVVEYGDASESAVLTAMNFIKIISEDIDGSLEFTKADMLMRPASRIAILGLGYHPVNMKRLGMMRNQPNVFGTCYGMTEAERMHHQKAPLQLWNTNAKAIDLLRESPIFQED
jgi:hypothetical protein